MSFTINVNGKAVHTIEEGRVSHVALVTSEGGQGAVGISPDQDSLNLIVTMDPPGQVMLADLDLIKYPKNVTAESHDERIDELNKLRENANLGGHSDLLTADSTTAHDGLTQVDPVGPAYYDENDEPVYDKTDDKTDDTPVDEHPIDGFVASSESPEPDGLFDFDLNKDSKTP